MLNLDLSMYRNQHTIEEQKALEDAFSKIQDYFLDKYISKNPVRRVIDYQIQYDTYVKTKLIINCNTKQVYITHGGHSGDPSYYFIDTTQESRHEGWKYVICAAILDNWNVIREDVEKLFGDCSSTLDLCKEFNPNQKFPDLTTK